MLYLGTPSSPQTRDAMAAGQLGQMLTYKAANRLVAGARFAIDNGVVKIVDGLPVTDPAWSQAKWLAHLDRHRGIDGCLFAVVPDAVGDAQATNELWARWHGAVRNRGFRPAYVLQNGCRSIPASAPVVFIGGDDRFKLGPAAAGLVREAKASGRWVHCGRVNTLGRLRYAAMIGCDSVDGTTLAWGPDRNLPQLLRWLDPPQPSLFGGVA